jgi:hypothetical protein
MHYCDNDHNVENNNNNNNSKIMLKFGAPRCVLRHGKDPKIFLKKRKCIVKIYIA